jgi:pyroglutamyl-peptidase
MKALVTGFEPFGGDARNPSIEVARHLPRSVGRYDVVAEELPVVYGRSLRMLREMIRAESPDCVICLGLAGGRRDLAIETLARNRKDARIPDNDGNQPREEQIDPCAPPLLAPSLPVAPILHSLERRGIPASPSLSAGTYLCNYVFYGLMRHAAREDPALLAGFLHLPYTRDLAASHPGSPSLELEEMVRGLEVVLRLLSR